MNTARTFLIVCAALVITAGGPIQETAQQIIIKLPAIEPDKSTLRLALESILAFLTAVVILFGLVKKFTNLMDEPAKPPK